MIRFGTAAARLTSRAGGRLAPKVGKAAAAGAGAAGAAWLISSALAGNNRQSAGDGSGSTTMGGGGLSGPRAGLASSRGFTAPSNDNSPRKVSYNPNGNYESESLKLQAFSANSLASIDSTVKNMLKFSVTKAHWDTRSLREMSIESGNSGSQGGSGGITALTAANGSGGNSAGISAGLIAAVTAVAAGLFMLSKMDGGSGNSGTGGSSPGIGSRLSNIAQQAGMGFTGAVYAGDARRMLPGASAAASGVAANDNRRSLGSRATALTNAAGRGQLGGAIVSAARSGSSRGMVRVAQFLKGLKSTPVGRFPYVTSIFASIDPIIELILSGGQVNDDVKKQLVGAIAAIIAGPAGIALGAALGAFVGIPATPVGMAVGAILGGIGGAIAALSAEFVAEQMYDLITGKITLAQFARKLGSGAMDGVRNVAAITAGAVTGGVLGAVRIARGAAKVIAPTAAKTTSRGLSLAAPSTRSVVGLVGGATLGGAALVAMTPSTASAATGPATMDMQGSELHTVARNSAEQYLGRRMTNQEWDYLLRAVYAESGRGGAGRENAMIMATILNRARKPQGYTAGSTARGYLAQGLTVLAVLYGRNQFQAVTGTAGNRRPSSHFTRGPNQNELDAIFRSVLQFLHKVPHGQVAFTAANSAAYGAGTNINYRDSMLRNGGVVIGGTVFNTSLMGEDQTQTYQPAAAPAVSPTANMSAPSGGPGLMSKLGTAIAGFAKGSPKPVGDEGSMNSAGASSPPPSGPALETLRKYNLKDESHISGLKGPFADKMAKFLHAASAAGKTIKINSGYRSIAHQARLYRAAVARYGEAGARRWVAPPGSSKHNHGLAVDLVYGTNSDSRGTQSAAGRAAKTWAHANAGRFGLNFRMSHEPWHVEPNGASIPAGAASTAARAGSNTPSATPVRTINWDSAISTSITPVGGSGIANVSKDSEGSSPIPAMSASIPETRLAENIAKNSIAAERKKLNIVVQNSSDQSNSKIITRNEKTDSSALESVSSPVMSAYEYASYWGVD